MTSVALHPGEHLVWSNATITFNATNTTQPADQAIGYLQWG